MSQLMQRVAAKQECMCERVSIRVWLTLLRPSTVQAMRSWWAQVNLDGDDGLGMSDATVVHQIEMCFPGGVVAFLAEDVEQFLAEEE